MSIYLSCDPKKEIIQRIKNIDVIKENKIDVKAQLEEIMKMNPLIKSKGADDIKSSYNSKRVNDCDPLTLMIIQKDALNKMIFEYDAIISDYNRGWRILTEKEKKVLERRYQKNESQTKVAKELGYDVRQIRRIEYEALRKMELNMTRF